MMTILHKSRLSDVVGINLICPFSPEVDARCDSNPIPRWGGQNRSGNYLRNKPLAANNVQSNPKKSSGGRIKGAPGGIRTRAVTAIGGSPEPFGHRPGRGFKSGGA